MHYFNKKALCLLSLSILLMLSIPFAYAGGHERKVSAEFGFSYQNKFVEEGTDELSGDNVFIPELVLEFDGISIGGAEIPSFFVGGELVVAESEDFTEASLFIGKAWEWDDFSLEFSYAWINEDEEGEGEDDHEFELGFSCECLPLGITPEIAYVYSDEAGGSAVEVELAREIEMGHFSIEPYVGALVDFGYVTDEYDGLNNILVGLAVNIPLSDTVSLGIYGNHSFAEENLRRDGDGDQTWGGVGLEFEI